METLLFLLICFVGCIYGKEGGYNILFLQSDEMEGRVLDPSSPYWNIVELPTLRSLASSGTNFVNTYCNSPLCAPSRASMWAGRYTNNILAWSNSKAIANQVESPNKADPTCASIIGLGEEWCINMGKQQNVTTTIKQSMISAGYDVQLYGKMDIGAGMGGGFQGSNNGNWSTKPCLSKPNAHYCTGEPIHAWARGANLHASEWQKPWANGWINMTSTQGSHLSPHDQNVANQCIQYIDNYAKTNNEKPFLLYCSMIDPHPAYWTNSTWLKKLNYTALNATFDELIKNFNGTFNNMHAADQYNSFSEGVGDIAIDTEWAYDLVQAYFATCAVLDYHMSLIINKLKSYPALYDNTLILYTSDHGELHLEHMQVEKMSLYEASARVPLIVKGPNVPIGVINNFTSLVDIFPTFMDTANIRYEDRIYPKNLNGYSLSPFFNWDWINSNKNNPYLKRPNYAFSEYHGDCSNTGQFMLRQNQYKLIVYATNPPFQDYKPALFNIDLDPNELENIADKNEEIVKNMTNFLNDILIKTGGGDYNFVDNKCQNEGKQNFLRWQTVIDNAGNNQSWISYTEACYTNFNENDVQRMENWYKSP